MFTLFNVKNVLIFQIKFFKFQKHFIPEHIIPETFYINARAQERGSISEKNFFFI